MALSLEKGLVSCRWLMSSSRSEPGKTHAALGRTEMNLGSFDTSGCIISCYSGAVVLLGRKWNE